MTQNSGGAKSVALLRKIQPDKPAIITELYTDYMNMWGWPVTTYPTSTAIYQQTVETLAAGGMYSYFMFYGGTNFGFWASTTWKSDESFVTTRYYARAPVAEGGAFNDSFWATKAANLLARGAERFLTAGVAAAMPVTLAGPVRGEAVQTPQGYLLFVLPQYPEQISSVYHTDGQSGPLIQTGEDWPFAELATQPGTLHVYEGAILELAEPSSYPSMLPFQLQADVGVHIDYSNATFLGVIGPTGRKVLLLRGAAGRRGIVAINGKRIEFVFSAADPVRVTVGGVTVLGLSREQADRTWFADGRALIGPYFVGEARGRQHECLLDGAYTRVHAIAPDGAITMREVPAKAPAEARVMLQEWVAHPLPEINMGVTGWKPLDAPVGVEALGAYWGYSWYRAALTSATSRTAGLLFTEAADRLTVFANGKRAGVWGRGPGAMRDPLPVELAAGRNELLFLCDNMGRLSEGVTPDRKGIRGPAYVDARLQPLPRPEWSNPTAAPSNTWQFQTYRAFAGAWSLSTADGKTSVGNLHRARYLIEVPEGEGLKLSLLSLPHYAWVLVDGQIVGEHAGDLSLADGVDFSSFILDSHLRGRMATLEVVLYAEARPDLEPHLRLYSYRNDGALTNWAFKPWTNPTLPGTPVDGDPTWWQCRFEKPAVPGPFFLVMEGLSKGQAYINGHALGRYWEIGPQHALYVPDTWLEGSNQLTIFDEAGRRPDKAYLIRDARVPSDTVLI